MTAVEPKVDAAFRCSTNSQDRGDTMAGTAPPASRVLIVHQPGPWGTRGLVQSRCDPQVAHRIDAAAAAAGMRLQTIRRVGKHEVGRPERGYLWGIADTAPGAASITWWEADDLSEVADRLEAGAPFAPPIEVETAPLFLICAHGKHDPCCALLGRPVARTLHEARPGRVWETTHLGGDRFAANMLVLPSGDLYGRVPPALAPEIAARAEAGDVVPKFMRGRIGLSPIAQAALIYAHTALGIFKRDALRVLSAEKVDRHRARATIATLDGTRVVELAIERSAAARLTCHGPADAHAQEYRGLSIT